MTRLHEDFARGSAPHSASNRAFGLVIATVLSIIGALPMLRGNAPRGWAFVVAVVVAAAAIVAPGVLAIPNKLLSRVGRLVQNVVSLVVLAILFYGVFTPIGLFRRARGADSLRLKRGTQSGGSYWTEREPEAGMHFERQF